MISKTPPRPMTSGFCNPTLPRTPLYDPHTNCRGCDCGCHTPEDPMPVTIPEELQQAAAAGILTPQVSQAPEHALVDEQLRGDSDPREPIPAPTPETAVAALQHLAQVLNEALAGYAPEDWRDAVRLLHKLRVATGTLKDVDASMVHWLYLHGEHGMHQHIDGVPGEFSITRGRAKERWDAEGAVKAYVEAQLGATGEMPDPLQVMAWVLEVVPATQSTSLRKTPLRGAGIDLEDYYWSEPGSLQVSTPT